MADEKVISTNRRAFHDYTILETFEAGLVLRGTEVKSLRESQVNFKDCYAAIDNNEAWLIGATSRPTTTAPTPTTIPSAGASSCSIAGRSGGCWGKLPSAG